MTIVGIDVSSRRVDLAWLEDGHPQRWHQELGDSKTHLIDRLRTIRIQWPDWIPETITRPYDGAVFPSSRVDWAPGHGMTDIAIEYPYAPQRTAIAALMATVGIITRQAPTWARVAWPSSGELRAAIGARNNKQDAHTRLWNAYPWTLGDFREIRDGWDEHELDALVACIGWTRILAAQDAE